MSENNFSKESDNQTTTEPQVLDLNTYREFLSRISGVTPDSDNEIVDEGREFEKFSQKNCETTLLYEQRRSRTFSKEDSLNPLNAPSTNLIPKSIVSYQCFTKATNPDNMDMGLGGFTPDDILEPENVSVTGMIDATCPEFTRFQFTFDTESEEGNSSYNTMKKALFAFDGDRMNINENNINDYIPFFFCELLSIDQKIKCNFCNPLLLRIQREIIEVIVPTALVSFTVE